MSISCSKESSPTLLAGFTTTATPSIAKGKLSRPYFSISSFFSGRPVLPISTSPSPACLTPTPEPPPATVMRISGFAPIMRLAASFMTGICAVPPAISILPFCPLKTSSGEAAKAVAAKRQITAAIRNFFITETLLNIFIVRYKRPSHRPKTGSSRGAAAISKRHINAGGNLL